MTDQRPRVTPHKPFTLNPKVQGRVLREYSGILPCIKNSVSHLLRCEHLRSLPEEQFPPYKVQDEFTHQLWIWYREIDQSSTLRLIFRHQFDFAVSEQPPDQVAIAITDYLAELLWDCTQREQLLQPSQGETDWMKAIETHLPEITQV